MCVVAVGCVVCGGHGGDTRRVVVVGRRGGSKEASGVSREACGGDMKRVVAVGKRNTCPGSASDVLRPLVPSPVD